MRRYQDIKEYIRIRKKLERLCNKVFIHYGNCENCDKPLCCEILTATMDQNETKKIAQSLKITNNDFIKKYLFDVSIVFPNGHKKIRYMINDIPCPFLKDNKCQIYPVRPAACREFPFQPTKPVILEGIEICQTATFIGSDVFEFVKQKRKKLGIPEPKKKPTPLSKLPLSQAALNPIEKKCKEIGIDDIVTQGYEDNYPLPIFLEFLKMKKII